MSSLHVVIEAPTGYTRYQFAQQPGEQRVQVEKHLNDGWEWSATYRKHLSWAQAVTLIQHLKQQGWITGSRKQA